jgi:hypothetical protein
MYVPVFGHFNFKVSSTLRSLLNFLSSVYLKITYKVEYPANRVMTNTFFSGEFLSFSLLF